MFLTLIASSEHLRGKPTAYGIGRPRRDRDYWGGGVVIDIHSWGVKNDVGATRRVR